MADFPFVASKKSLFRKCSQNILGSALRHFERIRWLLHCAMKLVWGTKGYPRPRYIEAERMRTPGAWPQKVRARTRNLEGLSESETNRPFGDDRPNIAKAMAADANSEISPRIFLHFLGEKSI